MNSSRPRNRNRKRKYNTAFLNKRKSENDPIIEPADNRSIKRIKRRASRCDLEKKTKYEFIVYLQQHKDISVEDCMNESRWINKLKSVKLNTAQKWRKNYGGKSEKFKKLKSFVLNEKKKGGKRKRRDSTIKSYGLFPTIEQEILRQRKERVDANRDHSMYWMLNAVNKLLLDQEKLDLLNLTDYEKENISNFKGSEGWCRNVMDRHGLTTKKVQSDRKITDEQYIEIRISYLPQEREYMAEIGIIDENGEWDLLRTYNGDEIPFCLVFQRRQICGVEERVSLRAPLIVGHSKHRYGTLVPFINYGTVLFVAVIVRGGPSILKNEIPGYLSKYKKWLLPWCNKKAYMDNTFWKRCMMEFEIRTRRQRGCNVFGANPTIPISLYTDNCSSHSTDQQKQRLKARNNIHLRDLKENCSHIQQQIDQNVGVTLKDDLKTLYWNWSESILDEEDAGIRTEKITTKEVRAKVFEFAFEATEKLSRRTHLLESSYINFGGLLPNDGSLDGDISTLHCQGGYNRYRYEDIEGFDEDDEDLGDSDNEQH